MAGNGDAYLSYLCLFEGETLIWRGCLFHFLVFQPQDSICLSFTQTKKPRQWNYNIFFKLDKLSQVVYNDMKSRMNKELWSQKIKRVLDQIGLGYLWTKAHENDIGILNIIKQRLKDIELQRWLIKWRKHDVRKDANQKNKHRTFWKFKTIENYKCEDYLRQVTNIQHRITLTKLRLSNHKLATETGSVLSVKKR